MNPPCLSIGLYRGPMILNGGCQWISLELTCRQGAIEIGKIERVRFITWRHYRERKKLLRQFYRPQETVTLINDTRVKFPLNSQEPQWQGEERDALEFDDDNYDSGGFVQ